MKESLDIIIKTLINSKLSNYKIAQDTGLSEPTIAKYRKKITKPSIGNQAILANYFSIRLNENGDAVALRNQSLDKTSQPTINYERQGVPYYNVDFLCGFDLIENDQTINPDYYIDFKQYGNADFWVNASGDSMRPTINSGDILALRQLPETEWQDHLMYGEIYALVTTQNRTIKKVRKSSLGNDFLRFIPENLAEYDEQDVKKITIRKVFQVLGCMKKLI